MPKGLRTRAWYGRRTVRAWAQVPWEPYDGLSKERPSWIMNACQPGAVEPRR